MSTWLDASSSSELWELLGSKGGLSPKDYDASLVADLAKHLALDPSEDLGAQLQRADISIERFVAAFFTAAAPFVMMWSELLAMFERANATASTDNLRVEYDFGSEQPRLSFDLEHFRQVLRHAQQVVAPVWFGHDTVGSDLWSVSSVFQKLTEEFGYSADVPDDVAVHEFVTACREGPWPSSLPPRPVAANDRLDGLIEEVWLVAETFLQGLRSWSADHTDVMSREPSDDVVIAGLRARDLRYIESDFWLPTLVATTTIALRSASAAAQEAATTSLDEGLARLRNTDPTRTSPGQRLEEFLSLPIWDKRYEVFSNWVCTRALDALDDQHPRIHSAHGVIEFRFSGTHLATFDDFDPRLHLVTELHAPLDDPVGEGRSAHIQPDIALRLDPLTSQVVPLAVECKQYKKANNKKFAEALTDYLRGLPDAEVILVDYGRLRDASVLSHVDPTVVDRAKAISEFRPDRPDALRTFRTAIRTRFGLATSEAPSGPGTVELTWTSPPKDLDLYVSVPTTSGDIVVFYQNLGQSDIEPYCTLSGDVTTGDAPETVTVHRWLPGRYRIGVQQYTDDGSLKPGGAELRVETPSDSGVFESPDLTAGQTWQVCEIDGESGRIYPPAE